MRKADEPGHPACRWFGFLIWCCLVGCPLQAYAADVEIASAHIPLMPPGANTMAAYMRITNNGPESITLCNARSEQFEQVMLHETTTENGIARMRHISSVSIAAGATRVFESGGLHIMLTGPSELMVAGERIPVTFEVDDGSVIEVSFEVVAR